MALRSRDATRKSTSHQVGERKGTPSTYEAVFQLTKQRFSPTMATIHMKRLQYPQLECMLPYE